MLLLALPAYALSVDTPLADAAQEARARALFSDLRCVVCEGESIADSPAEVARDMRREVRAAVAAGKSDGDIRGEFVTHYGPHVLMMPPPAEHRLLWAAPLLVLLAGGLWAWRRLFGRAR